MIPNIIDEETPVENNKIIGDWNKVDEVGENELFD